jgi:hypothetical protein
MHHRTPLLVVAVAAFAASPAFACGGMHMSTTEQTVVLGALATAPLLAALLVDRAAFALGATLTGLTRRHRPSIAGPLVAAMALVAGVAALSAGDPRPGFVGLALVPLATVLCSATFARSLAVDMAGSRWPRVLRAASVVVFAVLALARIFL